ncbi:reverse transcriptase domain-containing protein [Tanacetum coccineum]
MLTMEEMLAKFIDEGKREHEEMEIFIKEFRTTNELLLKERSNLLSELKIKGVQEKPHDVGVKNKSSSIRERTTQPLVKPQQFSFPKPALVQIPKYANYLKSLLTNKSRLEEACTNTMNVRCSSVLLNKLPLKEKDPRSFTIPCQVLEKEKEAEDLAADHLFRKRFFSQVKTYFWEEAYAFKLCADNIMRRCVAKSETLEILAHCHSGLTGGHHSTNVTAKKVYESGFYWHSVFKDANGYGLDFIGPFPQSRGNKYILAAVDYVSKWVEAQALPMNDARVVVKFLRQLFTRFGVPEALISDRWTHVCSSQLKKALQIYGVTNKLSTAYHPQSNGQTEVTNKAIKCILERSVGYNPKEIIDKNECNFKVNGQRLKKYHEGEIDKEDDEVIEFENGVINMAYPDPLDMVTQYGDLAEKKSTNVVIMEYLVKISKKERILELKRRHLKITILTSYTPYSSRKIWRICACTLQETTKIQSQILHPVMSSSSTVTYTSVYTDSKPGRVFWGADEELSNRGPEHPPSPNYVPGPEHPPSPVEVPYVPEPEYPEYLVPSNAEAPLEDQPLPADASLTALSPGYPFDDDDDDDDTDDEDKEPFEDKDDDEEEEEHLAPTDSSTECCDMAWKTVRLEPPMSPSMEACIAEYVAAPTPPSPPPSPLSPWSSPLPQIPSPPLPPPPSSLHLPLPVPTSLPLQLSPLPASLLIPPLVDRRENISEAELPHRKRLCPTAPTSRYKVGKSFFFTADLRPTGGHRADYGFIGTMDAEIRRQRAEEVGYDIREVWVDPTEAVEEVASTTLEGVNARVTKLATVQEQDTQDIYVVIKDTQDRQTQLFQRFDGLVEDRQFHYKTARLLDQEALIYREAWAHSVGLSSAARDQTHADDHEGAGSST